MGLSYKDAGVDIKAGNNFIEKIKSDAASTFTPGVLTGLGSFGSLFQPDLSGIKEPVLVSGTDGVGTKLKIAFMLDKHHTIGIDLVAMCVNDILAQGAKPLFFLDYLATGKLNPAKHSQLLKGITAGCKLAGAALIGGETAEMPDFYAEEEYELAGFAVGIVDKSKLITGNEIEVGDKVIGLSSSGIHSNGYSLVRKALLAENNYQLDTQINELGCKLGEELLRPTRIYVKSVLNLLARYSDKKVRGIAHITGGGLVENIPRILPEKKKVVLFEKSWPKLPIFKLIAEAGQIAKEEMYKTFNMGIGLVLIVKANSAEQVIKFLKESGEEACSIGEVQAGQKGVEFS